MWNRKKPFSLDVVSEKTVKFRCGVGIFRYVPFPIALPERKLFLTVYKKACTHPISEIRSPAIKMPTYVYDDLKSQEEKE
jgi:hypothetical protein